jgi:hypothetical protein
MKIAKPQVHLRKNTSIGTYMIHVVTWMDYTKFKSNGYATLPTSAVDGVFQIVLKITEDTTIPNMQLLTPVVHTLSLGSIELTSVRPFIEVIVINSSDSNSIVGKIKTHQDGADDSGMPTSKLRIQEQ